MSHTITRERSDTATLPRRVGRVDTPVWLLGAVFLVLCAYRAATQSIYHDEALTYLLFIRGSWRRPFAYTGNQEHVLFSLLAKLSTSIFGVSEFALRLPVLCAAVLFCVASAMLLRRLVANRWLRTAGFALLTFNPYTMDYLVAARGYGMMLGLLMLGIYLLAPSDAAPLSPRRAVGVGVVFGLSAAAIPITLFPFVALVGAYVLCEARSGRTAVALGRAVTAGAVALVTALPLLATQIYHGHRGDYYLGATTLASALGSVVRATWRHVDPTVRSIADLTQPETIVYVATIFLSLAVLATAIRVARRWTTATPRERTVAWLTASLALILTQVVVAHALLRLPYPEGRTALYWIVMTTLTAVLTVDGLASHRTLWTLAWCLIATVLIKDAALLQTRTIADVPYDAPGREIVAAIVADHAGSARRVTVGGSWQTEPSMNFYRVTRGLDWMAPVERNPPTPGYDYYVLISDDAQAARTLGLRLLFVDPKVGTILAVPRRHTE